ncbi:MAG: hypothetical protein VZS44_03190 [Bacilli bacterium]|nr:hypothetical protein [Bacilli bacterium]
MKNNKNTMIINIIKFLIPIIIIILIALLSLSYTINNNKDYNNHLIKNIKEHYKIKEKINYLNTYNNYYIFTTEKKVIVLDGKYKEVHQEELDKLAKNKNNYDIIYKSKKLMYENTIYKKNSIIYEYYDIKDYKKISSTKLEK